MAFVREKFELNQSSTNVTATDGIGANFGDIWDFKSLFGTKIILRPGDTISMLLTGDDAAEMPDTTRIEIVKRDVTNTEAIPLLGEVLYGAIKQFSSKKAILKLSITKEIIVNTDEHIVIRINGIDAATTGDLDASASRFALITTRERETVA